MTFWLRHLRNKDTRQEALRAMAEAISVLGGADENHAALPLPQDVDMLDWHAESVLQMVPEGAPEPDQDEVDAGTDETTLAGSMQNR